LMLGLAFGRIGCFLNGCCFGQPTHLFCAVTFPYGSPAYLTQVKPDPGRGRMEPRLDLPAEYFGYYGGTDGGTWHSVSEADKYRAYLKPKELLTDAQKLAVKTKYRAVPIHPTQLYSSADALVLCLILYTFWRKFGNRRPGCTLGLMFMLYGPMRFLLESIREDNPFRNDWWSLNHGWTVSQNLGVYLAAIGLIIFIASLRAKPAKPVIGNTQSSRVGS
ncbi:MAG: prolipoprotein diacylglyceryl transferase, partial [Planctomycetes bacterium]|nr:prolipoprotein diacylglyceryl transferase [Planctomycetota bacterium]